MITTEDFSTIWKEHYGTPLQQILVQYCSGREAQEFEDLERTLRTSGAFCESSQDDTPREADKPLDFQALHELRISLRRYEVKLSEITARVCKRGGTSVVTLMHRIHNGIVAIIDIAIASISHVIASCQGLPLPNVS